jgi:NADH-quinone oxidoreductase subunit G
VNSRGAADLGVTPELLPGYARVGDDAARARYGKLWGAPIPAESGMTARQMMDAAARGTLKALYVMGANPVKTFGLAAPSRIGGLDLLVVQDLFLTQTALQADVVLPAASGYEKGGTFTSTSGEVQMLRRGSDAQGPRTDFDLLRILTHQLSMLGLGAAMRMRTPEAVFEEIRQNVPGYNVSLANLLAGGAEQAHASLAAADSGYDVPAGAIFSSQENLFTSGSLGPYLVKLNSCNEAKETPWSSPPSTQSWWYR